jgi:RimJ/RimL family protein N-acetyltransferase
VQILTEPGNDAIRAAARAAGFTEEGVHRAHARARRGRRDSAVLSLLPRDLAR